MLDPCSTHRSNEPPYFFKPPNKNVEQVASEFSPARDEMAVEYQILVAAQWATSREMVA